MRDLKVELSTDLYIHELYLFSFLGLPNREVYESACAVFLPIHVQNYEDIVYDKFKSLLNFFSLETQLKNFLDVILLS